MDYSQTNGSSWYNALQIYLTRNVGTTWRIQANYTYSRYEDNSSVSTGMEDSTEASGQNDPYQSWERQRAFGSMCAKPS